jgi:deoxyribonuclease I
MIMFRIGALACLAGSIACGSQMDDGGVTAIGGASANAGMAGSPASAGAPATGGVSSGGTAGADAADAGDSGPVDDGGDASLDAGGGAAGASAGGAGGGNAAGGAPGAGGGKSDAGAHEPDAYGQMPYTGAYAGIETLSGSPLAEKLCELVKQGYRSMSYTAARQVVFWRTDNHGGQVQGIYDGFWHDPVHTTINIEHTWPQSKGADTLPARSDLHHLFPVQADFNSARGNLTFGEVVRRTWPAALRGDPDCADAMPGNSAGCYSIKGRDAYGVEVFEPRDGHKGDSARAVLYFSIRYGVDCKPKPLGVFDPQHPRVTEAVLKKWNLHDPPSDHERQRNDVIESEQGARNPFVDHPELVDRISFQ